MLTHWATFSRSYGAVSDLDSLGFLKAAQFATPGENLLHSKRFRTRKSNSRRATVYSFRLMAKGSAGFCAGSRNMAGEIRSRASVRSRAVSKHCARCEFERAQRQAPRSGRRDYYLSCGFTVVNPTPCARRAVPESA